MRSGKRILEEQYLEMRAKILALAADFDRIQRAEEGTATLADPRLNDLRACLHIVLTDEAPNRAERVQNLLSDKTPPPPYQSEKIRKS